MPDGYEIATAWVKISPDTDGFAEELESKIEEATAGAEGKVKVGADDAELDATLDDAKAKLDELDGKTAEPTLVLDAGEFDSSRDDATAKLAELDGKSAAPTLLLDAGEFDGSRDDATARLEELDGKEASPKLLLDKAEFDAAADEADARLDALKAKSATLNLGGSGGGSGGGGSEGGEGSLLGAATLGIGGLLPGIGGATAGLGLLGGTGALAFSGIAKALSAAHQASLNVGITPQQMAATNFGNSVQTQQAQQSVTQARQQAAQDAVTSDQSIQQADMNLAETSRNTAASQVQALQQVQQAQQGVQQATYGLSEANYNLGQAYEQAREQITQLNDQLADSKLSVASASLAVQQAEYQEKLVNQDAYSTSIQRQQASLAVAQAKQQVTDATDQQSNAQYAANLADKQGVNGSQTVIQAKQAQLAAQDSLTSASNSYKDAQTALTNTELNNQVQLKEAQMQASQAREQAAYQQKMDAQAVAVAERNVTNTIEEQKLQMAAMQSTANSAANQFAKYMANLTPAGRAFVNQVLGLRTAFKGLQADAQNATLPGFTTFLQGVSHLAPEISSGVTRMGGAISKAFARMGTEMKTPQAVTVLNGLINNGMEFANTVLPSIGRAFGAIFDLGSSKGAATGLSNLVSGIFDGIAGFAKGLKPYIPDLNDFFTALGKIAKALGPSLANEIGAVAKLLDPLAKFLNSKQGQPFITAIADIVGGLITLKGLAKILPGDLGKAVGGAPGTILKVVGKPLKTMLSSAFKSAFGTAAKDGEKAAADEVSNSGWLSGLAGGLKSKLSPIFKGAFGGAAKDGEEAAAGELGSSGGMSGLIGGIGNLLSGIPGKMTPIVEGIKSWGIWSGIASGATKTWTGIQWLFNAAMDANPIGLVVIAIGGLVIGVIEAYKHFTWFRDGVKVVFADLEAGALFLWHNVFDPLWHGIEEGAEWLYDHGIKQYFGLIKDEFKIVEDAALWLWHNVFDPVWKGIESGMSVLSQHWKQVWAAMSSTVLAPVNFLIKTVYDNGIARLWNDVTGAVGLGSLKLPIIPQLAGGGVLPGYAPGHDSVPALLSPGEAVLTPGATRAVGGASVINALNAAYAPSGGGHAAGHFAQGGTVSGQDGEKSSGSSGSAGGEAGKLAGKEAEKRTAERPAEHVATLGMLANGGIVQRFSLGGIVSGLLSGGTDTAKAITALATGNTVAFTNALAPLIGTSASGALGQVMIALPKTLVTDAAKAAIGMLGAKGGTSGGGSLTSQVQAWFTAAAKAAGAPASWIPDLETIGSHESSYNRSAVNMSDSNAAAGDPSRGIMQLIAPTFDAYHVPGTSTDIFDPVANIAAGIGYIRSRYGTPGQVPGIVSLAQGGKYVGYDSGGALPPGMTMAVNQTGRPEAILTPAESAAFQQIVKQMTAGGGAPAGEKPSVNVNYFGPQEPSPEQKAIMMRDLSLLVG